MVPPDSCFFMRSSDWGHQKLPLISAESSYSTHKSQSSQYRFGILSTSTRIPIPQEQVALWSGSADSNRHCTNFKSALSAIGVHPDASVSIPQRQHIQLSSVERIQSFTNSHRGLFQLTAVYLLYHNTQANGNRTHNSGFFYRRFT